MIRRYLERENISQSELSRRLGMRSSSSVHLWTHGLGFPAPAFLAKLAALLQVDKAELLPREGGELVPLRKRLPPAEVEARALEAHLRAPLPASANGARKPLPDVLAYTVAPDGQAELRVVARGPHARMAAVFRLLLDAGLVPGGKEEDAA